MQVAVKLGNRSQLIIPKKIRERLGLGPGKEVLLKAVGNTIVVTKQYPDLLATAVSGPTSADTEDVVTLSATVVNQGLETAEEPPRWLAWVVCITIFSPPALASTERKSISLALKPGVSALAILAASRLERSP